MKSEQAFSEWVPQLAHSEEGSLEKGFSGQVTLGNRELCSRGHS